MQPCAPFGQDISGKDDSNQTDGIILALLLFAKAPLLERLENVARNADGNDGQRGGRQGAMP